MTTARQRIHALWDELAETGSSGADHALEAALAGLCRAIDAQQAYWMGAVRMTRAASGDPADGWRPRAIRYLHRSPEREANYQDQCRRLERGAVDPSIVANLRGAGRFRVNIKHELVGEEWFRSEYYRTYFEPFGVQDGIFMVTPLGEDVESWFGFQRIGHPEFYFGDTERELLRYAGRSMKWFHRQIALNYGLLLADDPVTPSERRVLNSLLTEKTEKEIADELALASSTVHTYAVRIYRKFGVRGRVGLAALWLGQT